MDKPFSPISEFYKTLFNGERAQKIPVSTATDCPNRRGLRGMKTCIFCDEWGSAAYPELREESLQNQLRLKMAVLGEKYKANVFLAYFQAYTSTFMGLKALRQQFDDALAVKGIVGLIIGTRPDCLSDAVLELWQEFSQKTFVGVELGVQSFVDKDLVFLRRGHTAEDSVRAIRRIKEKTSVDLGVHLIFGLPGETDEQIVSTARKIADLPVDNVKLHNLHVLKNTPLADLYHRGLFVPIDLDLYTHRVSLFLEHLPRRIRIHRLAALSSKWDELVAPEWNRHKMKITQYIIQKMNESGAYQGRLART